MKIYLDTSVFGGYFEKEFDHWSERLIAKIIEGDFTAVISDITLAELAGAPQSVRDLLDHVISENAELITADDQSRELAEKYLREKVVTRKFAADALHIAVATIYKVDAVISWNFRHIVNLNRIRLYNSVKFEVWIFDDRNQEPEGAH